MAKFSISTDIFFGYHCCGNSEYTDGEGTIELTDEQVSNLVELIRENDGETDIEAIELKEKYPDIYEAIDEAYRNIAQDAEYKYWLLNGYDNGYYDEPEGFVEGFEKEGLFRYEPDLKALREELDLEEDEEIEEIDLEDDKRNAFDEWLEGYVGAMSDEEKVDFIETHYGSDVVNMDVNGCNYTIEIPQEIVDLAIEGN